jgi:hypothetical protein
MRSVLRVGFSGVALVAAVVALAGCGSSGDATDQVQALELGRCDVSDIEGALSGLEAGVSGTRREFEAPPQGFAGRNERQILRAMKENVASVRGQLADLESCARNALLEAEGKAVHHTAPPRPPAGHTVVAHRLGPPRIEAGGQLLPASPCATVGRNGTTMVPIFSDAPHLCPSGAGRTTALPQRHRDRASARRRGRDQDSGRQLRIVGRATRKGPDPSPCQVLSRPRFPPGASGRRARGNGPPPTPRSARCTCRRRPVKRSAVWYRR